MIKRNSKEGSCVGDQRFWVSGLINLNIDSAPLSQSQPIHKALCLLDWVSFFSYLSVLYGARNFFGNASSQGFGVERAIFPGM